MQFEMQMGIPMPSKTLKCFIVQALHSMGITSFESLAEADPRRIEIVAGRKFPFGNHIKESLLSLPPKVEMKIEKTDGQGTPRLAITLTRLTQAQTPKRHYADMVNLQGRNSFSYNRMDLQHSTC